MSIGGLQKLTLLDFPGHVACTVFTRGCNFRCPFCHNASLVLGGEAMPETAVFDFLEKRQGLLDGVAITGGEPLLLPELPDFIRRIRAMGFQIKLDTNGSFPARLQELIAERLVDYVAMDIKNSPEKYAKTAGTAQFFPQVQESVTLLLEGRVPWEFRTTVVDELHTPEDFEAIGQWLRGTPRYFLQAFVDSGDLLQPGLHGADREKMERCLSVVRRHIPSAQIRGL